MRIINPLTDEIMRFDTVKISPLYDELKNDNVKCGVCERRCVIKLDQRGFCKTKLNISGTLYTLAYGDISALESRPIEIKPFFHFHPGSTALTFATFSCNFKCPWCQNHHLSRAEPDLTQGNFVPPKEMVMRALQEGDSGLCASFQEPTMHFEYCLEAFPHAKEKGLYNCAVSNGYMTEGALKMLKKAGLDALKIDMKGDRGLYEDYCGGVDVERVWRNARLAKEMGIHVEIVNLVITDLNDHDECIEYVIDNHLEHLGEEVPLHFTRYHPAYKYNSPATKIEILERAYNRAKDKGVLYPYLGNVHGHRYENTFCPQCTVLLIKRSGCRVVKYNMGMDNTCPSCGLSVPMMGSYHP